MRSSVIAISSVNASLNATSRNPHIDESELELHHYYTTTALDTPPVEGPSRTGNPQSYEEFPPPTHPNITAGQECPTEQVPFPRSLTNTASNAAGVAPQEGLFTRCFTFLKCVGAKLMMPPYTIDGELNHTARKHDYINLDSTVTKLPLM